MQKIHFIFVLAISLSFTFISCDKKEDAVPTPIDSVSTSTGSTGTTMASNDVNATKLLNLVNDLRSKGCVCGQTNMPAVPALKLNSKLEQAAYFHAKDMNENNYFSHDSKDGRKFTDRIKATGYQYSTAGENIANGYKTEEEVFNGWKQSEGHCKNMMNGSFTEAGFALESLGGKYYWVQVFAKPKTN